MSALGTVQLFALAALGFMLGTSALISVLAPLVVRWTASWSPASRHRALMLIALAPLAVSMTALLAVALPSFLARIWPAYDHCLVHGGHAHLCLTHFSDHPGGWVAGIVVAAFGWMVARLLMFAFAWIRAVRSVRRLGSISRRIGAHEAWVVEGREALCFSFGWLKPRTILSTGLLESASNDELEVMLEHEDAHRKRRDTLLAVLARAGSAMLWPNVRRTLLRSLASSSERACDERAAQKLGDRLRVAETLLAMERRLAQHNVRNDAPKDARFVVAFGPNGVPERVEALLDQPRHDGAFRLLLASFMAVLTIVLASHAALHHLTESLLASLF